MLYLIPLHPPPPREGWIDVGGGGGGGGFRPQKRSAVAYTGQHWARKSHIYPLENTTIYVLHFAPIIKLYYIAQLAPTVHTVPVILYIQGTPFLKITNRAYNTKKSLYAHCTMHIQIGSHIYRNVLILYTHCILYTIELIENILYDPPSPLPIRQKINVSVSRYWRTYI